MTSTLVTSCTRSVTYFYTFRFYIGVALKKWQGLHSTMGLRLCIYSVYRYLVDLNLLYMYAFRSSVGATAEMTVLGEG